MMAILLINWPVAIGLAVWIFILSGLFNALLFVAAWIILDKVWDVITGVLIAGAGAVGANSQEEMLLETAGAVPARMAVAMILDLAGTLALPWLVAGYFLGGITNSPEAFRWWHFAKLSRISSPKGR